jgi:hypothetical protein
MILERKILLSILKLTKDKEVEIISYEELSKESDIPLHLIDKWSKKSSIRQLIQFIENTLVIEREQRLKIAIRAIELGVDIEKACDFLTWMEFEDIAILAFQLNGFITKKHFRFSHHGRKWEIDILGIKKPIIACIDCKQWHHGLRGKTSEKVAILQVERTKVLTELPSLKEKINIRKWNNAYFVPIILSLLPSNQKFYKKIPIVPILQLRDFIQDMSSYLNTLYYFQKKFNK